MDERSQLGGSGEWRSADGVGPPVTAAAASALRAHASRSAGPVAFGACAVLAAFAVVLWPSAVQGSVPADSVPTGSVSDVYLQLSGSCVSGGAAKGTLGAGTAGKGTFGAKTCDEELSDFSLSIVAPGAPADLGQSIDTAHPGTTADEASATMPLDGNSMKLFSDIGSHISSWSVDFRTDGASPYTYLTLQFTHVSVTSFVLTDSGGATSVAITFGFQGVAESSYSESNSGTVAKTLSGSWNLTANTKI